MSGVNTKDWYIFTADSPVYYHPTLWGHSDFRICNRCGALVFQAFALHDGWHNDQ